MRRQLWPGRLWRLGGKHYFKTVFRAFVQYFHDFAVGHLFVGVQGYKVLRIALLYALQKAVELVGGQRHRLALGGRVGLHLRGIHVEVFVDVDARAGFEGRLLAALRQVHLQGRRKHECARHHEEDEQQEYDIGHRRHAEHRQRAVLSF